MHKATFLSFFLIFLAGCHQQIERSGTVVDRETNEAISGAEIDIYLRYQTGDSLKQKVFTDKYGRFFISEKRNEGLLFDVQKEGYIGFVSSLAEAGDTIRLEKQAPEN